MEHTGIYSMKWIPESWRNFFTDWRLNGPELPLGTIWKRKRSGEGSRPPSVSGSIQLSTLPVGPEPSSRLFGLAPVGSRRFTISLTNVTAEQIILGQSCVVSGPLPWLSPGRFSRPTFLVEEGPSSAGLASYRQPPSLSWRHFLRLVTIIMISTSALAWSQFRCSALFYRLILLATSWTLALHHFLLKLFHYILI